MLIPTTDWKENIFEWYNVFLTIVGIGFILSISNLLSRYCPEIIIRTIALLGVSSLAIMGLHHPIYDFYGLPILNILGVPKHIWFIFMLLVIMPITLFIGNKMPHINKSKSAKINSPRNISLNLLNKEQINK